MKQVNNITAAVTYLDGYNIASDVEFKTVRYLLDWIDYNIGFAEVHQISADEGTWNNVEDFLEYVGWYNFETEGRGKPIDQNGSQGALNL